MKGDSDANAVREYLLKNPKNLEIAQVVYESWPTVRDHICTRFLERLCQRVKEKMPDCTVRWQYKGEKYYSNRILLYRKSWPLYEKTTNDPKCMAIELVNASKGPNGWCFVILEPLEAAQMTDKESKMRESLDEKLKGKHMDDEPNGNWLRYDFVKEDVKNWDLRLKDLHMECEKPGEITEYFVEEFTELASKAIPIITAAVEADYD